MRLYMGGLQGSGVADALAQCAAGLAREPGHQLRQVRKGALAADQHVEPLVDEQRKGKFHAPAEIPARRVRGRQVADLAGLERQASRVKGAAERERHAAQ
ncbi:hypothetical protein RZS08_05435, partial [Arthrospira platensis SPKY1]|nr:hypothetical protein [Arthrospira platensis SPKY1]